MRRPITAGPGATSFRAPSATTASTWWRGRHAHSRRAPPGGVSKPSVRHLRGVAALRELRRRGRRRRSGSRSAERARGVAGTRAGVGAMSSCGTSGGSSRSGQPSGTKWRCGCRLPPIPKRSGRRSTARCATRSARPRRAAARPRTAAPNCSATSTKCSRTTCATWARRSTLAASSTTCCARFPHDTRVFVVRVAGEPVAASITVGWRDRLEVPWASSLRAHAAQVAEHAALLDDAAMGGAARLPDVRFRPLDA